MMHNTPACTAAIIAKNEIMPGVFHLVLKAPVLASCARAGQFIMIQTQSGSDPLLRRPISLCRAGGETVEILFQVRGRGTAIMASWQPGHSVSIIGPCGNGFMVPTGLQTAVLVAGGIGAAPLLYLAESLQTSRTNCTRLFFFGSRNQADAGLLAGAPEYIPPHRFIHATEDGSTEHPGLVTDAFETSIGRDELGGGTTCIYCCGPAPMLKKVALIAEARGIPCQVSLETHMACGVGACLGCAVRTKSGFKRVCADGPVFDSSLLDWNND
jgi:dihydroorotate dehydrogenase electron transfer subunit